MVAFVILHYYNLDETLHCIESIKKIKGSKKIIVVDNHTLNDGAAAMLKQQVDDLLLLQENMGFAKANNNAIKFAISKYNPQYVVALNNDIIIKQNDFIARIKEDDKKYHFDMLGGKILTEGDSCNPFPAYENEARILKEIKYLKKLITIYKSSFLTYLLNGYLKIKHTIKKPVKPTNGKHLQKNVALHGCCLIFSKQYLEKYEDAFCNETFLFHEEDFLYVRIKKDHLKTIYDPKLEVYHKESVSLKKVYKDERLKNLFKAEERLKSLELLIKYRKEV